jgi:FMN phosphatase YigB (HAD superfamily)
MTLTLLLDLDDTLLSNNIDTFVPAYLKALGKHLNTFVAPDKMVHDLLAATQVMLANNTAELNLERSFDQVFYPAIGQSKTELRPMLEQFYDEVFPTLASLTAQRPEAIQLVNYAIRHGHTLVVATNPIFPRKAILHRITWAGLSLEHTPFSLVTDYEGFHFAKPNPAFFTEILAQLGWPNQPAVVIGNSLEDDLLPAAQVGLPAYWVVDPPAPILAEFQKVLHPLSSSGLLRDVPVWLEKVDAAGLRQEFSTPKAMLAVLRATPAALDTFSLHLTSQHWSERPAPDEWSVKEIICHLRDVDREVNFPRIEKVIGETNPFLAGINTDPWAEERNYQQEDGPAALREFIDVRTRLIARLQGLNEGDWQRTARHAIFGPTTLQELIGFISTHDRTHIQQCLVVAHTLAI